MSKEYPLYPNLTEGGEAEAQRLMDGFKPKILAVINELMGDLYTDVSYHIESDSWCNFRNEMIEGFEGYRKDVHACDFKKLRQAIYRNHKDEIIKDLNQDLIEENGALKARIESLLEEARRERSYR